MTSSNLDEFNLEIKDLTDSEFVRAYRILHNQAEDPGDREEAQINELNLQVQEMRKEACDRWIEEVEVVFKPALATQDVATTSDIKPLPSHQVPPTPMSPKINTGNPGGDTSRGSIHRSPPPIKALTPQEINLIRPFSGEGDMINTTRDLGSFLCQLKMVAGTDSERRLEAGRLRLEGTALRHLSANPELCESFKSFEDGLTKRFGMTLPRMALKEKFANITQNSGESLLTYAGRIRELGLLTWPGESHEVKRGRDEDLTAQFLRGLTRADLRKDLTLLNPGGLEEALHQALRLESTNPTPASKGELARIFLAEIEERDQQETRPYSRELDRNRPGMYNGPGRQQRQMGPAQSSNCSNCFRRDHTTRECRSEPQDCFECQGPHMIRDCLRERPRTQGRREPQQVRFRGPEPNPNYGPHANGPPAPMTRGNATLDDLDDQARCIRDDNPPRNEANERQEVRFQLADVLREQRELRRAMGSPPPATFTN
jgi:hypothetical protein